MTLQGIGPWHGATRATTRPCIHGCTAVANGPDLKAASRPYTEGKKSPSGIASLETSLNNFTNEVLALVFAYTDDMLHSLC